MEAKTLITKTEAMKLIGVKNKQSFDRIADLKGFTKYPGITRGRLKEGETIGTMYCKEDVITKHNMTKAQHHKNILRA